jgi:hypothetical protein
MRQISERSIQSAGRADGRSQRAERLEESAAPVGVEEEGGVPRPVGRHPAGRSRERPNGTRDRRGIVTIGTRLL